MGAKKFTRMLPKKSASQDTLNLRESSSCDLQEVQNDLQGQHEGHNGSNCQNGDNEDDAIFKVEMTDFSLGKGAFINLGFSEEDDISVEQLRHQVKYTKQCLADEKSHWMGYHRMLLNNHEKVSQQIEQRKQEMIDMINSHAQKLKDELEENIGTRTDNARSMISHITETLSEVEQFSQTELDKLFENDEVSEETNEKAAALAKDLQHIRAKLNSNSPLWIPVELHTETPPDFLLSNLFGAVHEVDEDEYPLKYHEPLIMLDKFSVKTKYDKVPCGLVDLTLTPDGDILVCDKNNKLLKVFDKNGKFKHLIGQDLIKDPTRVMVQRHTGNILVADNFIRFVRQYSMEGEFLRDFVTELAFPTSMAENSRGEIMVSEYQSKSVVVVDKEGRHQYKFPIQLPAPAHLTCNKKGHVLVSDWRHHAIKLFHITGQMLWKYRAKGDGEGQFNNPQGVSFDTIGNILVADTSNHRIRVLDDQGHFLRTPITKVSGLKLPVSTHCDNTGILYVAEYQGIIKRFRYIERIDEADNDDKMSMISDGSAPPSEFSTPKHVIAKVSSDEGSNQNGSKENIRNDKSTAADDETSM